MKKKYFLLLLVAACVIQIAAGPSMSAQSELSSAQIDKIQEAIRTSKNLSDKAPELIGNAHQNSSIATSNFEKSGIEGFREASGVFAEAEQKFIQARRLFDDAWIQMQNALTDNDLNSVQEGMDLHNSGVQIHNEGVMLQEKAQDIFNVALDESKNTDRRSAVTERFTPQADNSPTPQRASGTLSSPPGSSSTTVPAAAVVILLGTLMTSIQAFRNREVYDRFILHPWSIVQNGRRLYTLVTSGLIHANATHLMINLMSFSFFAFYLENMVGHKNFLIIYFGSLIISSLVVTVKNGANAHYRALGASGAIAGVIFSYILHRPDSKLALMIAPVPIPAPLFGVLYIAYSYYMSKNEYDNIGHDAHLWGAISGLLITMVIDPGTVGRLIRFLS